MPLFLLENAHPGKIKHFMPLIWKNLFDFERMDRK